MIERRNIFTSCCCVDSVVMINAKRTGTRAFRREKRKRVAHTRNEVDRLADLSVRVLQNEIVSGRGKETKLRCLSGSDCCRWRRTKWPAVIYDKVL